MKRALRSAFGPCVTVRRARRLAMRRIVRPGLRLGIVLAAVGAGGCATEGRVEDGLEDALAARLGPADVYEVDVEGLRAGDGEADLVLAEGLRVRPAGGPVLDRITLELKGARYDRELKRLVSAESVRASVWVQADDLAAFLERRHGSIQDASITLAEPDRMRVRFRPDLGIPLLEGVTAEVEGWVVGRGPELHFVVGDARAAGFRLNGDMAENLTRFLNPVVDLSDLPLGVEVTSVRIEDGALRMDATGDVTTLGARLR